MEEFSHDVKGDPLESKLCLKYGYSKNLQVFQDVKNTLECLSIASNNPVGLFRSQDNAR